MPCPEKRSGQHRRRINYLLKHPWNSRARRSDPLRRHLDAHGYLTPNFQRSEMADTITQEIPEKGHGGIERDREHCWNLERFARRLGRKRRRGHGKRVAISIDGPSRTSEHNAEIHGAEDSQHIHERASDHFVAQVARWEHETGLSKQEIVNLACKDFTAIGTENSGTLHFDSRPGRKGSVLFVTWAGDPTR
jgi:hypothetical protein